MTEDGSPLGFNWTSAGARKNDGALSWETRLQIAVDAAQDWSICTMDPNQAYSDEGGTHVSTVVAGTPGYLEPDCYTSSRLTEKSDVFSFGVVLLEMITGQPAILRNEDRTRITEWVDSTVKNGDIKQVIDPSFRGNYDVNAVWKAVELALACASGIPSNRPTMNTVVMELKECLAIDPGNSIGMVSMDLENSMAPRL
ncbi:Protein kinase domain-containing protein [Heracleum sosnowskyi]|uniref:Protein kinase domain-containing protein n=1 Tax=Heracleum sosnowskyi TaxID=360622 RepID=A0AAD8M357_9APIA|nr:Protein kinase domain-containing protein [Heracleum sosnowskyi]